MNTRYYYLQEKFFNAIQALVVGTGDVRSRLWTAYLHVSTLRPEDFPDELRQDWQYIIKSLKKFEPIYHKGEVSVGSVQHTLRRIKNRTGSKIAERFFHLFSELHFREAYR
jgi:hypothetical protein